MNFISEELQQYLDTHSAQEPELLQQLNRETHQKVLQPRMLSGAFQGRILSLLSKLKQPKNILEIGTYTGYASLCLAEGMTQEGVLDTIDCNEELTQMQRKYFDRSPYGKRIQQHLGSADKILPKLSGPYDLVFMDADKENYPLYFDLIIDKMSPGALLISDNVLWSGKVLKDASDEATQALKVYNDKINKDSRVETVILPIRDGLTLSRKR
jgi:predicted O-methyltransferase YrrM